MEFICEVCGKAFKYQYCVRRHLKTKHNKTYYNKGANYECMEEGCDGKFRCNSDFVDHLQHKHLINIEHEEKTFSSQQDFLSWKHQIENSENCKYVINSGSKLSKSGDVVSHYKCNRSGVFKSKAQKGGRLLKSQGTCKINRECSSQIIVYKHPNNTLSLRRIITHYGHTKDLQHIRLPKVDRENIAAKLIAGVSQTRILDTYRSKIGNKLKRVDLLTNKDLLNIKRNYKINVQEGVKHREDAVSLDMWVEECKSGSGGSYLKQVDRIIKATKGKQTETIKGIIQRHRVSIASSYHVENIEHGTKWEISGGNDKYFIEKRSSARCCQLFCQFCNICIHNYTCSCTDFNIKNTICEHIHYICNISEKNPNFPLATSNIDSLHNVADDDITKCLGNVQKKDISEKLLSKFNLVANKVHNTNLESIDESLLLQMLSQIQNLESLLNISLSST